MCHSLLQGGAGGAWPASVVGSMTGGEGVQAVRQEAGHGLLLDINTGMNAGFVVVCWKYHRLLGPSGQTKELSSAPLAIRYVVTLHGRSPQEITENRYFK